MKIKIRMDYHTYYIDKYGMDHPDFGTVRALLGWCGKVIETHDKYPRDYAL